MRKIIAYISIFFNIHCLAQPGKTVFNDSIIHEIKIQTPLSDWFTTLEEEFHANITDPDNYPEIYHTCDVTFDGFTISNCGFREKGNASNTLANFGRKNPLKIAFDKFDDNQTFDGLKKINLNIFINDPSLMHDAVCNKLMRDAGLYASRTAYTKVWVNGEYIGLYLIIENVDKTFLKSKYGGGANNDGNLYKTDRGASVPLDWQGSDKEKYKQQVMKLTTNESADDWTGFIDFVYFLNNYSGGDFKQQLENRFDIHSYLKALAVEKCVRSWDSYWGGGNNYYLYDHPDGKWRWIPWDMNETFQDIKVLSGTTALNGYLIPTPQIDKRPLLKKIFQYDDYKNEYLDYCCDFIQTIFNLDNLGPTILRWHNLIDETYRNDPNRLNSYSAFQKSLTDENEDVVSLTKSSFVLRVRYPGIFPFIQESREWVVEQENAWEKQCEIKNTGLYNLTVFPNPAHDYIEIKNEGSGFEYAQFKLISSTGNTFYLSPFEFMTGIAFRLELPNIPPGFYLLLKQEGDGRIGRAKIIIE
jgi:hypothetical protein